MEAQTKQCVVALSAFDFPEHLMQIGVPRIDVRYGTFDANWGPTPPPGRSSGDLAGQLRRRGIPVGPWVRFQSHFWSQMVPKGRLLGHQRRYKIMKKASFFLYCFMTLFCKHFGPPRVSFSELFLDVLKYFSQLCRTWKNSASCRRERQNGGLGSS